jgi:protein O-mannosyl-transferase
VIGRELSETKPRRSMQRRSVGQAPDLTASRSAVSHGPGRRSSLLFCVLLAAGTVAVYSQAGSLSFISIDDPVYASQNPLVQAGFSPEGLRWSFGVHDYNWIPFTWWSLMLDSNLFGIGPAGYHITNVLLHVANTLLLFATLATATGNSTRSAFVAGLFAIHPLHVESVAWVAERKDVLSVFFGLLSLRAYVGYAKKGHAWRLAGSFLLFVCSLLSKPTLVTLPFVFLLLDYWPLARLHLDQLIPRGASPVASAAQVRKHERTRQSPEKITDPLSNRTVLSRVAEKIPFFAGSAAFSAIALFAQSSGGAMKAHLSFSTRCGNAIVSYLTYLEKAAYPVNLAVFYPHPNLDLASSRVALAAVILLAVTAAAIVTIRRFPFLFVGWSWYLGTLVPMIGLVQVGAQQMADRYSYFPLIGIFLSIAWLVPELAGAGFVRERVLPITAIAALLLYSVLAFGQVSYWRDSVTLLRHAQSCTPENVVIHNCLGAALFQAGKPAEAAAEFQTAIRLAPPDAILRNGLASSYLVLGRKDEALAQYRLAATIDPSSVEALVGMASILIEGARLDEARGLLERANALDPGDALIYCNWASLSVKTGDFAAAISYADQGLARNPRLYVCDFYAAQALRGQGRFDEAARRLERFLEFAPGDAVAERELKLIRDAQRAKESKK